jgi:hypothetical protein
MRITPFLIVVAVALIFLIPKAKKERDQERQEQEEVESTRSPTTGEIHTLRVRYAAHRPEEAPIADIIWIKKAAEIALDSGTPYFNVLKQQITHRFSSKYKIDLPVVHGIIQLEDDPMRAEYDAHEIEGLILSNSE